MWLCKLLELAPTFQEFVTTRRLEIIDQIKLLWRQVSPEGVKQRDEMVFQFAKDQNAPVIMLTSGVPSALSLSI